MAQPRLVRESLFDSPEDLTALEILVLALLASLPDQIHEGTTSTVWTGIGEAEKELAGEDIYLVLLTTLRDWNILADSDFELTV